MTAASDWRQMILDRVNAYQSSPMASALGDPPPPQLIEAQIDLESSGNPNLIDPGGAVGLGQIVPGGMEFGYYKDNVNPNLTESDLTTPATNLDIMILGMAKRKHDGDAERAAGGIGSYADWYMSAAGYLGGANEAGFNTRADSYGTTGEGYVQRIHNYIFDTFGGGANDSIDGLGPGRVEANGYKITDRWPDANLYFNQSAKAAGNHDGLKGSLISAFIKTGNLVVNTGKDALGVLTDLPGIIAEYAPRAGIGVLGIVVLGLGVALMLRPSGGE